MEDRQLDLITGALLHDIGKVIYRTNDGRNHSTSGYEFVRETLKDTNQDILDQIRYHHYSHLKGASLEYDSLAYITYFADNVAAAADRREGNDDIAEYGFNKTAALQSVFNILNNNQEKMVYEPGTLEPDGTIRYPVDEAIIFDEQIYMKILRNLQEILGQFEKKDTYVNSLLEVLEANLTYVPSSTSKNELADVSLFDHVKITAAVAVCIYQYLKANNNMDYRSVLFLNAGNFYEKNCFLLISMDLSGIQSFIYNIASKNALKNLRSRSFYLELMLENLVDELLDRVSCARTNLIYTGGGHAYLLLPNTQLVKQEIEHFEEEVTQWLLEQFQTELYCAIGYVECSADDLKNAKEGSYRDLFRNVSKELGQKKLHRLNGEQVRWLNSRVRKEHERECRICHRSDRLNADELCEVCTGFLQLSKAVQRKSFFSVVSTPDPEMRLPVFRDRYIVADTIDTLRARIQNQNSYIRSYSKNDLYIGDSVSTKLWVGSYSSADSFQEMVDSGTGIRRLGVLRADIDDLGKAFVQGFHSGKYGDRYTTISRNTAFSRKLSLFFKLHMNDLLENGSFSLTGEAGKRNASIVYSGGDDLFIVGAWKDILEFSVDLYHAVRKYTQGTLTISAGLGIFDEKFPIAYMADQTGELEDKAKQLEGKNAVTLFSKDQTYHWEELINTVLGEKFQTLTDFFGNSTERGKGFLYRLLDLMRNQDEQINLARFAYTLARLEPSDHASEDEKQNYRDFAENMYRWNLSETDRKQLITAIYVYVYLVRQEE